MQALFPVIGSFSMLGFALDYRNELQVVLVSDAEPSTASLVANWPELGLAT